MNNKHKPVLLDYSRACYGVTTFILAVIQIRVAPNAADFHRLSYTRRFVRRSACIVNVNTLIRSFLTTRNKYGNYTFKIGFL